MGMSLTVYVGPYLIVPKHSGFPVDWMKWDTIVCDGRGEAGSDEKDLILIPNCKLDGIERTMQFERHGEQDIVQISPATIVRESAAFSRLASEIFKWCDSHEVEIHEAWGVVPHWG